MQRWLDLHKWRTNVATIGPATISTVTTSGEDQMGSVMKNKKKKRKKERKKERIAVKTKWVLWLRKKKRRLGPSKERKKNWRQRRPEKGEKKERKVEKEAALEHQKQRLSVLLWQWVVSCVFNYKSAIGNWVLKTEIGVFNFHNSSLKN